MWINTNRTITRTAENHMYVHAVRVQTERYKQYIPLNSFLKNSCVSASCISTKWLPNTLQWNWNKEQNTAVFGGTFLSSIYYVVSFTMRIVAVTKGWNARVMMFNATFNNISATSWRSVLLVEETGVNHRPVASHWQILSHICIEFTSPERDSNSQLQCWYALRIQVVVNHDHDAPIQEYIMLKYDIYRIFLNNLETKCTLFENNKPLWSASSIVFCV
jgi:hypothetical protein